MHNKNINHYMPELPLTAFRMTGEDEKIELIIEEVFGFPNETSYGGGYGAKGTLTIEAGEYKVVGQHYFTTGELYNFYSELMLCYDKLDGEAVLHNTEHALELKGSFDKIGHVTFSGSFQTRPDVNNILYFKLHTDQTQIRESLSLLRVVNHIFGDMTGIVDKL